MSHYWILDERGEPAPCGDVMAWSDFFAKHDARRLAHNEIGDVQVSTVFLGIDHSFGLEPGPVLWETMVFGGQHDQYQRRYRTKDEALAGHAEALALVGGDRGEA